MSLAGRWFARILTVVLVVLGTSSLAGPLSGSANAAAPKLSVDAATGRIVDGPLRIEVLSPTLLRLEYAADGVFEDRRTMNAVARHVTPPPFTARRVGGDLQVRTAKLLLDYREGSGRFTPSNTSLVLNVGGQTTVVHPAFGNPDRADALGGWYRGLDYYPAQAGTVDQIKLHQGFLHRHGWYLLDDTNTAVRTRDGWVAPRPSRASAYQDGYLFGYGHDYAQGLKDLRLLTGRDVMLPKWAFGTWFSEYNAFSASDYEKSLVPAFRAHHVPLDVLVADTDWKSPNQWAGWNWNPSLFPHPAAFLRWVRQQKLQLTLNVHAAISAQDPKFAAAQATAQGGLAATSNSFAPDAHIFDWSNRAQAKAWTGLHKPFEQQGVRQWWLDYCCDASGVSVKGLTADSWVNELYRRQGDARGLRGFALSRIGDSFPDYKGVGGSGPWAEHRSTVHFTGDTQPDWPTLAFATQFTPNEGASIGLPYVSHDIGSFAGKHLPEDLYLRWIQLGAFQPVLRLHSDHGDRLPWQYSPAVRGATEKFLRLRDSLVPYLYDTGRQAYDTGLPLARALYLDWPGRNAAYQHGDEYMLGDSMLVAPITTPGLSTTRSVWFPPGTWTDFFTGTSFRGPATRTVAATPGRMPVFLKAGAIVPQAPAADNVASQPKNQLTLTVAPHAAGRTVLYDDAGEGLGYRDGQFSRTPVTYTEHRGARLVIGAAHGTYAGQPSRRGYTVVFDDVAAPRHVTVDGAPASYRYARGTHRLTVQVPQTGIRSRTVVAHDARPVVIAPQPAVATELTAPSGLTAGQTSTVVEKVTNSGPGAITNLSVTLPKPSGWTIKPTSPTTDARLAVGRTFTVSYSVTPVGTARDAVLVAYARYHNPDGSTGTAPAELTVAPRPVQVTFETRAPAGTPADATLYVPGNINQLGPWDPAKVAMTKGSDGIWRATVTITDGTDVQYKYTRGSWNTVENWGSIVGTVNRDVVVDGGTTGKMTVDDTSTAWSDSSIPDVHKAPEYWRDPLVVSTTPSNGASVTTPAAVTATFERDIAPTGADYSNSVTVTQNGTPISGTTTEPTPGTLSWTPSAPLPAGSYQVTVDNVQSVIGSDSIPMQKPYTYTFTVQ
jgi:hypothetical protein